MFFQTFRSYLLPVLVGLLLSPTGLPVSAQSEPMDAQPEEMTVQKGWYLGFSGGIGSSADDIIDSVTTGEITVGYQFFPDYDRWWGHRSEVNFSYSGLGVDCPSIASCSANKFQIGGSGYHHFPLPNAHRWVPYFGVGFGYAKTTLEVSGYNPTHEADVKSVVEAGGIYAEPKLGISYSFNESFDGFFQFSYQWVFSGDPKLKVTVDGETHTFENEGVVTTIEDNYSNFMLGMRYRF